ncbi:hypothetical protein AOLI_G00125190 [Acnodon oligacanthus]
MLQQNNSNLLRFKLPIGYNGAQSLLDRSGAGPDACTLSRLLFCKYEFGKELRCVSEHVQLMSSDFVLLAVSLIARRLSSEKLQLKL